MKKGESVNLTEAEQRLAKFLAAARYEAARKSDVTNQKIGPQSNEETDLEGIAGEIAFCKLFNLYPDLRIGDRKPYDALMLDGCKVDIKTTKYTTGKLLAAPWKKTKELPIDVFVLMIGEFPGPYKFCGCMDAKELMQESRLTNLGHGKGYAANQSELYELLNG